MSVRFDVRDLGGHLETTFRGWSSTLAARVRLVISRLSVLPDCLSYLGICSYGSAGWMVQVLGS